MGVIVVGVDHSEGAKAALQFALSEAKLRHATLRAVHAWQFGYIGAPGLEDAYPYIGADLKDLNAAAEAALAVTVAEVISDAGEVDVVRRVVEGAPGAVLVEESQDAELLVVGSRGHGGFAGLLLGSSVNSAHTMRPARS
jgi:nucleotide-binding universal stress UspA family protein